jgi:enamine deaminase RidA (YjgF/YER057c/UK114 family)
MNIDMRKLALLLCFLCYSTFSLAQSKKSGGNADIRYIGSNKAGTSDAVIVEQVPLAHTRQFLSIDKKGNIIGKNDLSVQFKEIVKALGESLKQAGSATDRIVKLNVYLSSPELITQTSQLISAAFPKEKQPAVTYVAGDLSKPGTLIAIDAVAGSNLASDHVQLIDRNKAHIDVAVMPAGPVVYVSGQAAKGGLAGATRATLQQLSETLTSLGLGLQDVVQIKSFLSPMTSIDIVESELSAVFKSQPIPPLVFVDWISSDPVIEIELIAASPAKTRTLFPSQIEYLTPPKMVASPVFSKVVRLNYGKQVYISSIHGNMSESADAELRQVFNSLGSVLSKSGSDFNNLLKATYYIGDDKYSKSLTSLRPDYYDATRPPAASKAKVKGVGLEGSGVSIDMIATVKE